MRFLIRHGSGPGDHRPDGRVPGPSRLVVDDGGNIELTGVIKTVRLGNPHGILKIDVEGEEWRAEVGQPWRNERAGLKDGDLPKGSKSG